MKCYYHPDRDPIGMCIDCGKFVCAECKVLLGGKIYCNPCTEKLIARTTTKNRRKATHWFARHLNWTEVIMLAAIYPIDFAIGFIFGLAVYASDPYASDGMVNGMVLAICVIINVIIIGLVSSWVLIKKSRSLWNLFWLIVPFGVIAFLCLENESHYAEMERPIPSLQT